MAMLTGESACPTLVRKCLHLCGAGAFACELHFFSASDGRGSESAQTAPDPEGTPSRRRGSASGPRVDRLANIHRRQIIRVCPTPTRQVGYYPSHGRILRKQAEPDAILLEKEVGILLQGSPSAVRREDARWVKYISAAVDEHLVLR